MDSHDVVKVLKTVPEKRLRLIELAWELADEHGRLDLEKGRQRAQEISQAKDEASAYAEGNRRVLSRLQRLVHS